MRSDTLNASSGKYGGRVNDVVFVKDAAAVNISADDSGKIHVIPDLTADSTFTLPTEEAGLSYEFWYGGTAADSGKIHIMPDLTADCTISFPTEAVGLVFEFWYGGTAADAQDWTFDTGSDTNYFVGGAHHADTDGELSAVVDSNGSSNSSLGVLTPIAGTLVKVVCNGTVWYINGQVVSATDASVTFADQ